MIIFKTSGEELYRDDSTDIKQTVQAAIAKKIDLSFANLVKTDLSGLNLTGAILSHADLRGVNFNNCFFDNVDLSNANAYAAVFSNCIIKYCAFAKTNLVHANFTTSYIMSTSFIHSKSRQSDFTDCTLIDVNFKQANLSGSKLCLTDQRPAASVYFQRDKTLAQQILKDFGVGQSAHGIYKSNFQETQLCAATFRKQALISNNWVGANCVSTDFTGAEIENADMRQTELKYSTFDFATLRNANFNEKTLTEISFEKTEFRNFNARGALFEECDFTGATFTECDFAWLAVVPNDEQDRNCTVFSCCALSVCAFKEVSMPHVKFIDCDLRTAVFIESIVTRVRFEKSNLLCTVFKKLKKPYGLRFSGCSLLYSKFYTRNMKISVADSDFRNADLFTPIDVYRRAPTSNFQGTILDPVHAENPDFIPSNQPPWDLSFPGQPLAVQVPVDPSMPSNLDENPDISNKPDDDEAVP